MITLFTAVAVTVGALTCTSDLVEPSTPGALNLRLATPGGEDGGILFSIEGAPVDSIASSFPNTFLRRESESTVRVVIVGDILPGVLARVLVPDTRNRGAYSARVLEVAERATFRQRSLTGYSLTVENVP
jgi:hypothetical protein